MDAPYDPSVISPRSKDKPEEESRPIAPRNGVRAPNPRLCFDTTRTGYLYDALLGAGTVHIVIFASDLQGPVRAALARFSSSLTKADGFYRRFGGRERFNVVLVAKCLPFEVDTLLAGADVRAVREVATVLCDDRAPDEDAHTWYEVDHARGAVVVIRPDLWVGASWFLDGCDGDGEKGLKEYLGGWLLPVEAAE